jgi:hypothetical protein
VSDHLVVSYQSFRYGQPKMPLTVNGASPHGPHEGGAQSGNRQPRTGALRPSQPQPPLGPWDGGYRSCMPMSGYSAHQVNQGYNLRRRGLTEASTAGLLDCCHLGRESPSRFKPWIKWAVVGNGDYQMIKLKNFTLSLFGASVTWEMTKPNKEIAQKVIRCLEDRRLLFGPRGEHPNDPVYCLKSAQQLRDYLGEQFQTGEPGKRLAQAIQEMRRACRRFIDRAGPQAVNFQQDRDSFLVAASELRTTFGFYVAALASKYGLTVDDDLASILPPQAEPGDE